MALNLHNALERWTHLCSAPKEAQSLHISAAEVRHRAASAAFQVHLNYGDTDDQPKYSQPEVCFERSGGWGRQAGGETKKQNK